MNYWGTSGWPGGAMVLGKFPVSGRPTYLDYSRASAFCACSRCRWVLFGHFFLSSIVSLFFLTLWETVRNRLQCTQRAVNPKTTNKLGQRAGCLDILLQNSKSCPSDSGDIHIPTVNPRIEFLHCVCKLLCLFS